MVTVEGVSPRKEEGSNIQITRLDTKHDHGYPHHLYNMHDLFSSDEVRV